MDESLWELFWTTGLPEAYALAKEAGTKAGTEHGQTQQSEAQAPGA